MTPDEITQKVKIMMRAHGVSSEHVRSTDIEPLHKGCNLVFSYERADRKYPDEPLPTIGIYFNSQAEAEIGRAFIVKQPQLVLELK